METVKKVLNDPNLFKEARYSLIESLPKDLGSLSLGYSNGEFKIYFTKLVGEEGCIDWNIGNFVNMWKDAIHQRTFTPELSSMFQGVTNELMPGFSSDIAGFHWFLRPHAQNNDIGFALFGTKSYSILGNDPNSLNNLQFFSQYLGELIPLSSFVFRRVQHDLNIGFIMADVFIMVSSTSNIFFQICFKFLFNPLKLNKNVINIMSSKTSTPSKPNSTTTSTNTSRSNSINSTNSSSLSSSSNSSSPGLSNSKSINTNTNGKTQHSNVDTDDGNEQPKSKQLYKTDVFYPTSTLKWLFDNKFSWLTISVAGLALSSALKTITKDIRVKL